jgi:hypothetical protein
MRWQYTDGDVFETPLFSTMRHRLSGNRRDHLPAVVCPYRYSDLAFVVSCLLGDGRRWIHHISVETVSDSAWSLALESAMSKLADQRRV